MKTAKNPNANLPDLPSLGIHQLVILVADDEVMIRNLVTLLLQGKGFVVLSASDGQEALELSRSYPGTIDMLITDMEMPRLNGMDLCAHLREERPGIKMVVMSGADMKQIVGQNLNLPFLPKPFDGETLMARVQGILAPPVQSPKHEQRLVSLNDSPGFSAYQEEMKRNLG
jgi:DNA-binding response OmpR family regulator